MIIISPAKNLNIDEESYIRSETTEPIFKARTNKLLNILKGLKLKEFKELMNVSDSLAELNFNRLKVHSTKNAVFKPNLFIFR